MFFPYLLIWLVAPFVPFFLMKFSKNGAIDHIVQEEDDEAAMLRDIAIQIHNREHGPTWAIDELNSEL